MTRPADPRVLLARSMSEAQLQGFVLNAARDMGWLVYHARPGMMRSGRWSSPTQGHVGWPDLAMVHPVQHRFLIAELKGPRGRLEPEQHEWLSALQGCPGVEAYLWDPESWQSGEILRVLSGGQHSESR